MKGYTLCSEYHSVYAVAALDFGIFPEVFSNYWVDHFVYSDQLKMLDDVLKKYKHSFKKYEPCGLVSREEDCLIWRPDPEWNYSGYRVSRYIKFVPIELRVVKENGEEKRFERDVVIAEWETGHDYRSSFIDYVMSFIQYTKLYTDLPENIIISEPYSHIKLDM